MQRKSLTPRQATQIRWTAVFNLALNTSKLKTPKLTDAELENPNKRRPKRFYRLTRREEIKRGLRPTNSIELVSTKIWPGGFRLKTPYARSKRPSQKRVTLDFKRYEPHHFLLTKPSRLLKKAKEKEETIEISPW